MAELPVLFAPICSTSVFDGAAFMIAFCACGAVRGKAPSHLSWACAMVVLPASRCRSNYARKGFQNTKRVEGVHKGQEGKARQPKSRTPPTHLPHLPVAGSAERTGAACKGNRTADRKTQRRQVATAVVGAGEGRRAAGLPARTSPRS